MEQFKYTAKDIRGRIVQGIIEAENKKEAKKQSESIAVKRRLKIQSLRQKVNFIYRVRRGTQEIQNGEQKAYSKEELQAALEKLGFKVLKVQKKFFDFKGGVPSSEITSWIRLCADLLHENLAYNEILDLLGEDTTNKRMREVIKEISKDLKEGKEGTEVFGKHESVFGKFPAFMLAVASTSGNMAEIYESTAKFMQRDEDFKKSMKKALVTPFITLFVIGLVVAYYVMVIFPKTAGIFLKMGKTLPPMTATTMDFSNFLQAYWMIILAIIIIPAVSMVMWIRTPKGLLFKDKYIIRIPVIGDLLHKMSIEIFARVFYSLYSGSGENIEVIRIASEACRNSYIEKQMREVGIPLMLGEGKGIVEAMEETGVFTKTALSRFRSGAESGALRSNALQLANYYEAETSYRMEKVVTLIDLMVTMIIMVVMVGLTIVSSETSVM
ncbi:MAG: type II secretion system F family protein [Candidatus Marinimicrobia bacterium]|nr:type II secretion system F family protein [Candidatus Neomarinimicrobiota bacterium]